MSRELLQHLKKSHKQHQQQALQLQEQLSLLSEELEGIPDEVPTAPAGTVTPNRPTARSSDEPPPIIRKSGHRASPSPVRDEWQSALQNRLRQAMQEDHVSPPKAKAKAKTKSKAKAKAKAKASAKTKAKKQKRARDDDIEEDDISDAEPPTKKKKQQQAAAPKKSKIKVQAESNGELLQLDDSAESLSVDAVENEAESSEVSDTSLSLSDDDNDEEDEYVPPPRKPSTRVKAKTKLYKAGTVPSRQIRQEAAEWKAAKRGLKLTDDLTRQILFPDKPAASEKKAKQSVFDPWGEEAQKADARDPGLHALEETFVKQEDDLRRLKAQYKAKRAECRQAQEKELLRVKYQDKIAEMTRASNLLLDKIAEVQQMHDDIEKAIVPAAVAAQVAAPVVVVPGSPPPAAKEPKTVRISDKSTVMGANASPPKRDPAPAIVVEASAETEDEAAAPQKARAAGDEAVDKGEESSEDRMHASAAVRV